MSEGKRFIEEMLAHPETHLHDAHFGPFATALVEERQFVRPEPISYRTWGAADIDEASHAQMRQACALPVRSRPP